MQNKRSNIEIICLESDAFHALVDEVFNRITKEQSINNNPWITDEEAMQLLNIRSKTTLQSYRDNGKVRFTQPSRKVILYDRHSIMQFLDDQAKDKF